MNIFLELLIIIFFFQYNFLSSQEIDVETNKYFHPDNILIFADHLFNECDYARALTEYKRYISYTKSDMLNNFLTKYKLAKCQQMLGDYTESDFYLRDLITHRLSDSLQDNCYYQIGYNYFLQKKHQVAIDFYKKNINKIIMRETKVKINNLIALSHLYRKQFKNSISILEANDADKVSKILLSEARLGQSLKFKSPLISGILSAVLPGAGRIYCNRPGDGLYSIILIGLLAYQSWDGFNNNANRSTKGYIYGSLAVGFYVANIYGSIISAKIVNKKLEEDYINDIWIKVDFYF